MAEAARMKEEGNEAFEKKRWEEALTKYEMASAVFRYLTNGNPEWRTQVSLVFEVGFHDLVRF